MTPCCILGLCSCKDEPGAATIVLEAPYSENPKRLNATLDPTGAPLSADNSRRCMLIQCGLGSRLQGVLDS